MICLLLLALTNIWELDLCPFWNANCINAPSLCHSEQGLCSQFAESGKMSEDPCLELVPCSRRRHSGAFFLPLLSRALCAIPCTYKQLLMRFVCIV